ncbi:hypothetical protein FF1_027697 [Malus domestica]
MVTKPAEQTPLSALYHAHLAKLASVPDGVFNVIIIFGKTAGAAISHHMDIDKAAAKSNLKQVSLELGGKSPPVIFDDADINVAADLALLGILFNQLIILKLPLTPQLSFSTSRLSNSIPPSNSSSKFSEMSIIARRGIHFFHKLNAENVPVALIEKGQSGVIDASLTLIGERAKLKGELVRALGGAVASTSLLGVPLGHNSSFLQGPAFGPPRIREAIWCGSTNSTTEEGKELNDPRVLTDVGDVPVQEI